ncbi:MAG TPA: hypothetical protein VGZ22_20140, partial [Isosphaeraceae bacterium]|nr:hypothetical protein [Isosphaeraceae bacterium]
MRLVAAASFLLILAGCAKPSPPPPAKAAKAVVGQWLIMSINGKPIPEGTTVTVDYKPDGRLVVEKAGGDGTVALPDEAKLKAMLDAVNLP